MVKTFFGSLALATVRADNVRHPRWAPPQTNPTEPKTKPRGRKLDKAKAAPGAIASHSTGLNLLNTAPENKLSVLINADALTFRKTYLL